METPNRVDIAKGEVRATLENLVEKAKEACERLQNQTTAALRATDRTIRENPYQTAGIAFGVGVLIGVLVMRSRRD